MNKTPNATTQAGTYAPIPVFSVKPVVLPTSKGGKDLEMRVSAPITGDDLAAEHLLEIGRKSTRRSHLRPRETRPDPRSSRSTDPIFAGLGR